MYLEENHTSFITITNPDEAFIDILDEFPTLLEKDLFSLVETEVTDIFPTSISITLKGDRYDILEAIGQITQLLVSLDISNFNFTYHTVEQLEDAIR
jgi:hypothetical protein